MKVILHDPDIQYHEKLCGKCDEVIYADGKYAPCQGCFGCWTKHPAECFMKDSLKQTARVIGQADEFVIITENLYGTYSPAVKNVLDRSIGISTPLSTYRGKQMHHTLRYGKHGLLKVIVYGDISDREKETFGSDYLISDGKNKYSVPFDLIGEKVQIRLTKNIYEVFFNGGRVVSHDRLSNPQRHPIVVQSHMPQEHRKSDVSMRERHGLKYQARGVQLHSD